MRILVVDDESAARHRLATLIDELGFEVVGEASDGLTALTLVDARRPDVILLDIAMPEVDGFDVARHLQEPKPLIVFQTAYAEYALKAFEHDALDYVVKPVTRDRLAQALDRAHRRLISSRDPSWTTAQLIGLGTAVGHVPVRPARLLVRHGAGHSLIPVASISRFTAGDDLVYAHASQSRYAVDYTLTELESRLVGAFVRVSRTDLISIAHISGIRRNGDGSATLSVDGGVSVRVSRRRTSTVRELLKR